MTKPEMIEQRNATSDALHVMAETPFTVEPGDVFEWPDLIAGCEPTGTAPKPKRGRGRKPEPVATEPVPTDPPVDTPTADDQPTED